MNFLKMRDWQLKLTIFLMVFLAQTGIDIYLPAMPVMAFTLHASERLIQYSMTAYLASFGIGQVFLCPLSDIYGRKPVVMFGFCLYTLGALFSGFSHQVHTLMLGRILTGAGAAIFSGVARAIARDCFEGADLAKMFVVMSMSWGLVPMLAPLFGSYLLSFGDWWLIFHVLCLLSLAGMGFVALFYNETNLQLEPNAFSTYFEVAREVIPIKKFYANAVICLCLYCIFMTVNMVGPFLFQNRLHLTFQEYAAVQICIASGYFFGIIVCTKLIHRMTLESLKNMGLWIGIVSVLVGFYSSASFGLELLPIILTLWSIQFAMAFIYPVAVAASLNEFTHNLGVISSLFGFILYAGTMVLSFLIGILPMSNQNPMLGFILFQLAIVWIMIILLRPKPVEAS